jgi:UDP-hydrolysing UDP-N-acetyl-D-glucosamine 2-epimerase
MRTICVVTGSRAEYGILYWLMRDLKNDPGIELQVIACAAHLSPEFGLTKKFIQEDGFLIDAEVDMLLSSDTPVGVAKSMGLGTIGFADAFERLGPDIIVLVGDRFEILAAAQTALVARIPIAHIHGGETSEGSFDEAIRHSITKMAHLHFVSADAHRNRVIQLGEHPSTVHTVGAPSLDHAVRGDLMDKAALEDDLGFPLSSPIFLATYHPATLGAGDSATALAELLKALDSVPVATTVMSSPNADTGGRVLAAMIDEHSAANPGRFKSVTSLGQTRYLSLMAVCDVVIGNSSSGIIEAPFFGKPTVNIGDRQLGRLRAPSVIDCDEDAGSIKEAIAKALAADFAQTGASQSPFGSGDAAEKMRSHLVSVTLDDALLRKKFYDLPQ